MIIITSLHASLRGENLVISSDSVDVASSLLLDNLVVTATRTPKTLKDVPVVTTLIPASEIKKSDATTIRDLLTDEMPGLEFGFAMSQETALSMNGMGRKHQSSFTTSKSSLWTPRMATAMPPKLKTNWRSRSMRMM